MMIIIIFFFLPFVGAAADAAPKDDAYHYMKNGVDDQLYNELWRFNGADNSSQFMITFLLSDPENLSSSRKIQVQAVVLQEGKPPLQGSHQSRGYGGDRNSPMFDIDKNGFSSEQAPSQNLKVWGEVLDETTGEAIAWDLVYQPAASPWFSIPVQPHIGHLTGDWMRWLVYMASANVSGSITIGNRTLNISGTGYHDHIWGRFALNDPEITWAQASVPQDSFSLTLGEIKGEERNAFLGIKKDGETIKFSEKQIKINYTNYAFDNFTAAIYPSGYNVSAKNGDFILDLNVSVQKSVPTIVDYPAPSPSHLAFQQYSLLQGRLRSKSGEEYSFRVPGFSGFMTQRLHPIFGRLNITDPYSAATPANITLTATNERTNQMKVARVASSGFYSVDANYTDYLANSGAPWVADGDKVRLEMKLDMSESQGSGNSTVLSIDLSKDRQEANL
jgi:hypothetical protein